MNTTTGQARYIELMRNEDFKGRSPIVKLKSHIQVLLVAATISSTALELKPPKYAPDTKAIRHDFLVYGIEVKASPFMPEQMHPISFPTISLLQFEELYHFLDTKYVPSIPGEV